ncbi:MAG: polysaccharide deacetylase family protein [Longicatena sp.]
MDKKTFRDVLISCTCFILAMLLTSFWIDKKMDKTNSKTTSVVQSGGKKVMYLTFDDGPSKHTQEVLDILDKYKVKATFFVTGTNKEYYNMINKESENGHSVGVHTFSHSYDKIYANTTAYFADLEKMNELIAQQTGSKATFMRFPGGSSNTVSRKYQNGIMSTLTKEMSAKGYQYYDWNASNGDGNCYLSSERLVAQATKEVGNKQEVMILMHDGTGNKSSVEALPSILENMLAKGYEFKIINNDTPVFHHHIAN